MRMFRQSTDQNHYPVFWYSINGRSIQMLLREENDSKQSDEFQAIRLNAAAFVKFFVIRVRRLFKGQLSGKLTLFFKLSMVSL